MHRRILVVEDEAETARDVKRFLERNNYMVDVVESGEEALKTTEEYPPSLVVLDIMLKDMNGIEVLRQLRTSRPRLPVIVLTQLSAVKFEEDAFDLRADDYMMKSRGLRVLVQRVEAVLRDRVIQDAECLSYDELTLYPDRRKVLLDGNEIQLRRQLFNLLLLLMRNAGYVISRDRLYDHLEIREALESENISRAVDRYVTELRKVLHDTPQTPRFIETEHGIGYRFKEGVKRCD